MTSFTDGTRTISYRYDQQNRRTHKIEAGKVTRFLYQGQNEMGSFDGVKELRILSGLGLGAEIGSAIAVEREGKVLVPLFRRFWGVESVSVRRKERLKAEGLF